MFSVVRKENFQLSMTLVYSAYWGSEMKANCFLDKHYLEGVNFCKAILEEPWVCDGNGLKQDFVFNIINKATSVHFNDILHDINVINNKNL